VGTTGRDEVDELLVASRVFDEALNERRGLDEAALRRLQSALKRCAAEWEGRHDIPRMAANVLVDLFPATQSIADAYDGDERLRIQEAAFHLQDLVMECVGVDPRVFDGLGLG
jgi:hypothetical protein